MLLPQSFYNRSTLKVAQDLLGCFLVEASSGRRVRIVETEAYKGWSDKASHASRGRTRRNQVMFGPPGYFYVYLVYGMHHMVNVVTEKQGYPAAVLLRAGEVADNPNSRIAAGPAKLAKYSGLDLEYNNTPVFKRSGFCIEARGKGRMEKISIIKTTRVGVDYAGECKNRKWRFYLKDCSAISRK